MPKCKKCHNNFPYRVKIDGKIRILKSRSYCLDCSPFNSKAGYKLRREVATNNRITTKICPICSKEFSWTKNDVCSVCRNRYTRYKNRLRAIEFLGGQCIHCGNKDIRTLTFHHIDSSNKSFNLAAHWHAMSWKILEQEIQKCMLLCRNCHAIEHTLNIDEVLKYYKGV